MQIQDSQNEEEVAKRLEKHFALQKLNQNLDVAIAKSTLATVTLGVSKGPVDHKSSGWISYWEKGLGKVHIETLETSKTGGTFIAGGILTGTLALLPDFLDGKIASFTLSGQVSAGLVSIGPVDGHSLFTPPIGVPVTGAGTSWPFEWKLDGTYRFTHFPA